MQRCWGVFGELCWGGWLGLLGVLVTNAASKPSECFIGLWDSSGTRLGSELGQLPGGKGWVDTGWEWLKCFPGVSDEQKNQIYLIFVLLK